MTQVTEEMAWKALTTYCALSTSRHPTVDNLNAMHAALSAALGGAGLSGYSDAELRTEINRRHMAVLGDQRMVVSGSGRHKEGIEWDEE